MVKPERGIPLIEYIKKTADGSQSSGTSNTQADRKVQEITKNWISDDNFEAPIRCDNCFSLENLICPGMSWLKTYVDRSSEIHFKLACPNELESSGKPKNNAQIIDWQIT